MCISVYVIHLCLYRERCLCVNIQYPISNMEMYPKRIPSSSCRAAADGSGGGGGGRAAWSTSLMGTFPYGTYDIWYVSLSIYAYIYIVVICRERERERDREREQQDMHNGLYTCMHFYACVCIRPYPFSSVTYPYAFI